MTRSRVLALLVPTVAIVASERWARRTRASRDEQHRPLPGDDLVPQPMWQATRTTDISAPPAEVWPWLVQMGFPTHRAGWYTPFWLDRLLFGIRAHSATRVLPERQQLAVGDRVPDSDDGSTYFTAAVVDPPRLQAGWMLSGIRARAERGLAV